jgi:AcrR family transcriptional regulator
MRFTNWQLIREAAVGTKERREREKRERRAQILESARKLFWKNGFGGTTMPDIASDAELAPGTLYLYFPSKDALYTELLVDGYAPLIKALKAASEKQGTPHQQAEALLDAFIDFARDCPECFDIIFFVLQRESSGPRQANWDEGQLQRLVTQEDICKDIAGTVFKKITPEASDFSVRRSVNALWSMLAGVVFFWRREDTETFNEIARAACQIILDSLPRGAQS